MTANCWLIATLLKSFYLYYWKHNIQTQEGTSIVSMILKLMKMQYYQYLEKIDQNKICISIV